MTYLRIAGYGLAALVALLGLGVIIERLADPFGLQARRLDREVAARIEAQGKAATATQQVEGLREAMRVQDAGRERDTRTIVIHEANRDQIRTAPGADAPLDPEFIRRLNRGLCLYAANAPHCGGDQVRGARAAVVPPAGDGNGAVTP